MQHTISRILGTALYSIAKYMPASTSRINIGQKQLRRLCCKLIAKRCGKKVNIDRNVDFTKCLSIGDRSGIGKNSSVGITVSIGDDVMIGPELLIYSRNHNYNRIDIPMISQGFSEEKPVSIGDDVWIGARVIILGGGKYRKSLCNWCRERSDKKYSRLRRCVWQSCEDSKV